MEDYLQMEIAKAKVLNLKVLPDDGFTLETNKKGTYDWEHG